MTDTPNTKRQDKLDTIADLIESGEASVEFDDMKITHRSLNELTRIERRLKTKTRSQRRRALSGIVPNIDRGID